MGSQSGIGCSNELANFLSTSRGGSIRMIKVGIEQLFDRVLKCVQVQISSHSTPALELENKWEASGSWEEDWEALVSKALQVIYLPASLPPPLKLFQFDTFISTAKRCSSSQSVPGSSPVQSAFRFGCFNLL